MGESDLRRRLMASWASPRYGWAVKTLSIVGAAILGNAAWEFGAKPAILASWRVFIDSTTAFTAAYRDSIYATASAGLHESVSDYVLPRLVFLIVLAFVFYSIEQFRQLARGERQIIELQQRVRRIKHPPPIDHGVSPDEELARIEADLTGSRRQVRLLRRLTYIVSVSAAWIIVSTTADLIRLSHANSLASYFDQLRRIAAPYVSREDDLRLASDYTLVTTRSQYLRVIRRAEQAARRSGQSIPTANPW